MTPDPPLPATARLTLVLLAVALAVLGWVVVGHLDERDEEPQLQAEYRVPNANPPVDPNRPDLLEEPRIDE